MSDTHYRRIIHVDMDAFFASVEQRDHIELRGRPVAVGGSPDGRGVVAAASYEAREYGVRSAMPSARALKQCPGLVFVRPRFEVYRAVSHEIRAIFATFTDWIEPLSLDEAYLDVSDSAVAGGSGTRIAEEIRRRIHRQTGLTASAGVSFNKFLAKLASDVDKPDGLYVIRPGEAEAFVAALAVRRFHGIGPATAARMQRLGIHTGADLRKRSLDELRGAFGRSARHYWQLARGIDERPVRPSRSRKSVGAERTFGEDLHDRGDMHSRLDALADEVGERLGHGGHAGRTLTLKVRFSDFRTITRSVTQSGGFLRPRDLRAAIPALLDRGLEAGRGVRLLGLTVSNLDLPVGGQGALWDNERIEVRALGESD
jgi:DNA polymerase IV